MMLPLGIARDLGADHPGGVRVVLRAMDPADPRRAQAFHFEGAGGRAIVRTGAVHDLGLAFGDGVQGHENVVAALGGTLQNT
jgi:hypothetical protein